MRESKSTNVVRAINRTPADGSGFSIAPTNESAGNEWFAGPVRQLLPVDAGGVLNKLTGVPASTCYRYASPEGTPTLYFYRKLLFLKEGETWLNVLMDGCEQSWWREMQRARRIMARIDAAYQE